MERNLLIVDDELEIVRWLEEMFRYDFDREIGVYTARSGKAALELLNRVRFDVVLTDIICRRWMESRCFTGSRKTGRSVRRYF